MKVVRTKVSSRCKDGSIVSEYYFDQGIPDSFIAFLKDAGSLTLKDLCGMTLFTFEADGLFSMKGMTGDTLVYMTYARDNAEKADQFLRELLGQFV